MGGDSSDITTGVNSSKNAIENNIEGSFENAIGMAPLIGWHDSYGQAYDSAIMAPNLTDEEIFDTFKKISSQKGAYNPASDYVELWMRAPEQIGQLLPGPIGTAMAILAATDVAITNTDKANLVQLLNEASKDYLSDSNNAGSMTALNKMIERLGAGSTNTHLQSIIKNKVESNVNNTQKGNNASSFDEHAAKDNAPTLKETTDGGTLIFHENIGGHTIIKHVGKTDEQLLARFDLEPNIKASSTFKDAYTADKAIGSGILSNEKKISNWMKNSDETRLIIQHEVNFELGNVIYKGETKSHTSKKLVIIIDKDPLSYSGYRVHTAYPK